MPNKTMAEIIKELVAANPNMNNWLLWDKARKIYEEQNANSN